jgi:hypothetical protein
MERFSHLAKKPISSLLSGSLLDTEITGRRILRPVTNSRNRLKMLIRASL